MASFQLLNQREEEELHKSRLLNVAEKPFKRITKRLLTPGSLACTPSKLPTPPPDNNSKGADQETENQKQLEERRQFREDVQLDFAAFDSSIVRIQFLRNSNEQERERYKADKQRILETAQAVRDNTADLRLQLDEAMNTLEQRKKFDELAEKITNNKLLRPREDQANSLKKLEEECRELERESRAYSETWKERREQFGRIVEEGMQLRRLIRDEKEEVERREGMDGGEEDGEVGEAAEVGSRGGHTPKHSSQSGNAIPGMDTLHDGHDGGLKPRPSHLGSSSRSDSRAISPAISHESRRTQEPEEAEEGEDTTMGEMADIPAGVDTPQVIVGDAEDKMDTT